jgi:hypothetical protein
MSLSVLEFFHAYRQTDGATYDEVALCGLVVSCLPLDQKFARSNPADNDGSVVRLPSVGK